jgi:hypothetical protein
MKRYNFSKDIQDELKSLKCIKSCSSKSTSFTSEFKLESIKKYNEGMTPTQIFKEAGVPLQYFAKRFADGKLRDWKNLIIKHGEAVSFTKERRGSKGKESLRNYHDRNTLLKSLSKDEKIAFYEAENEMLRFGHKSFTVPQAMIFLQDYRLGKKGD